MPDAFYKVGDKRQYKALLSCHCYELPRQIIFKEYVFIEVKGDAS